MQFRKIKFLHFSFRLEKAVLVGCLYDTLDSHKKQKTFLTSLEPNINLKLKQDELKKEETGFEKFSFPFSFEDESAGRGSHVRRPVCRREHEGRSSLKEISKMLTHSRIYM
jgi:hypothetical protein